MFRKKDKEFYRHPFITKIIEYDNLYQTTYYQTLKYYLYCFGSLKETAKSLDIHYNSMKYRLNKIEEITECSLRNNNELRIQLLLSLLILSND